MDIIWTFVDPFERTNSQDLDASPMTALTYSAFLPPPLYFFFQVKNQFNIMQICVNFLSDIATSSSPLDLPGFGHCTLHSV